MDTKPASANSFFLDLFRRADKNGKASPTSLVMTKQMMGHFRGKSFNGILVVKTLASVKMNAIFCSIWLTLIRVETSVLRNFVVNRNLASF